MEPAQQKLQRFWLIITLAFLCATGGIAQSPTDEPQTQPTTGSITGQVLTETGQPLAGASVFVRSYGGTGQGRTTTSDAEGNFQVSGLDPLTYIVSASFSAYVPAPRDPDATQTPYYRIGDSVRLQLMKGGVITGLVSTAMGDPVVGIRVQAYMIRDRNGQPLRYGMPVRVQTTDDRGIYRIYGLGAGTYVVAAGGGRNFSGFISYPYDTDAPTYAPSSTRDTAMEVNVNTGGESSGVDIRYRGEQGHIISGSALDPTATIPSGFTVYLSSISKGVSQWSQPSYQAPGIQGFSFYGVADGDYDVIAQTYSVAGDAALSEPRRVTVSGSNVTGIELAVKPLGAVLGHVALEESKTPECKGKRRPVFAETLITPWHNEKKANKDKPQFLWSLGSPTFPDKQGDFVLRNLASGQYRFHTRPFAKYWYLQSILLRPSATSSVKATQASRAVDAARNWTTVKAGDRLSGLIITLAEGAASLKGQITLTDEQKLPPRAFIYLVPAEPEKAEDVLRFFSSLIVADGSFALNNLPPGRYWTVAKGAAENESNVLSKLRLPDEDLARKKLRQEAQVAKTEIELKPCQNVTGYQLPLARTLPTQEQSAIAP